MNQNLFELSRLGQSIWYDNLSRAVLNSGELAQIIKSGVTGLTSNPTIFNKAIGESSDYDSEMLSLKKENLSIDDICEELMIADVAAAADLLKDVYLASDGVDGYASIEVSPLLAYDAVGTVEAGRRIWNKLNRPNIMIKVPATLACLPAIETLLAEGINVNVTLIFSLSRYSQVLEAYLKALEKRLESGLSLEVASVASFFVSRVDASFESEVNKLTEANAINQEKAQEIVAQVGVANSILAFEHFKQVIASTRFVKLQNAGAKVQRPLWASTSTKNPKLDPLLYVKTLALPETVNTVPPATLKGILETEDFAAQEINLESAERVIAAIAELGISFDTLLYKLEVDGVKSFEASFEALMSSISNKI